jgi:multiple antibiotic resistance protein
MDHHMDPLGNIPVFMSVLNQLDPQRRHRVLIREPLISWAVLLVFLFLGQYLLHVLTLRQEAIGIAGGIVLFLIALRMIFPQEGASWETSPRGSPSSCLSPCRCWPAHPPWRPCYCWYAPNRDAWWID